MPAGDKFKVITEMAHKIADTAVTQLIKSSVCANISFLKMNRVHTFTSIPITQANQISRMLRGSFIFLTENHKGYCAYFAGAPFVHVAGVGYPCRIVVGFLTEDRSE